MGFREHIFDLQARLDIPFRYFLCPHLRLPIVWDPFPFPDTFHDFEGQTIIHTVMDQIDHDVITTTDNIRQRDIVLADECFGIAQINICSVGKTGNLQQFRKCVRTCLLQHSPDKARPEFGNSECTGFTEYLFRRDTQYISTAENLHDIRIIGWDRLGIDSG